MATKFSDLLGESLIAVDSNNASAAYQQMSTSELNNKVVAIYFSAHWCPPCQLFTPQLVKCYNKVYSEVHERFDIVFVSLDNDEESFNKYFRTMPWKAIPYSARQHSEKLCEQFRVDGIPTLIVLQSDGQILSHDGRNDISNKGADAIRLWLQGLHGTAVSSDEYLWPGVVCSGCQMKPLVGKRYRCSTCDNCDLCSACQQQGHEHELKLMSQTLATVGELVWKRIKFD